MRTTASVRRLLSVLVCLTLMLSLLPVQPAQAVSTTIVISQVYGGGGNSGATLKNDFIELYNLGTTAVNVTGWTVQYAHRPVLRGQKPLYPALFNPEITIWCRKLPVRAAQLICRRRMRLAPLR